MEFCQSQDNSFSNQNYRILEWLLPDDFSHKMSMEFSPKDSELRSKSAIPSNYLAYKSDDIENFYRTIKKKSFYMDPKNYCIQDYEAIHKIERKLVNGMGSNAVSINNPNYFDEAHRVFQSKKDKEEESRNIKRVKFEIWRNRKLNEGELENPKQPNRMNLLIVEKEKTSECIEFDVDSESECEHFQLSSSEEELDKSVSSKKKISDLYSWAEQFIQDKLCHEVSDSLKQVKSEETKSIYGTKSLSKARDTGKSSTIPDMSEDEVDVHITEIVDEKRKKCGLFCL